MKLQIQRSEPLNIGDNSRLVFTLAPLTLVRVGPDLDTALEKNVVSNPDDGSRTLQPKTVSFCDDTYSPKTLVIIIDCFESRTSAAVTISLALSERTTHHVPSGLKED